MLWRQEIDVILAWETPSPFALEFPYDMDNEGYPVGRWDIRRAYENGRPKLILKYLLHRRTFKEGFREGSVKEPD
ncbi:unnamed protein product [Allacma fusca]|uniref:Uncharacterized protein n=1 Tax=Allacma fusca TaxID=39272 RepID=A0A8J2JGV9_9HEXA|nr:unnamed protein product [Allacma fusca]